jgi:hypothetical protein
MPDQRAVNAESLLAILLVVAVVVSLVAVGVAQPLLASLQR